MLVELQLFDELQEFRLDSDVNGGGRLVGNQQVRGIGNRHGDHDALALAAGKLVRIGIQPVFETRGRLARGGR